MSGKYFCAFCGKDSDTRRTIDADVVDNGVGGNGGKWSQLHLCVYCGNYNFVRRDAEEIISKLRQWLGDLDTEQELNTRITKLESALKAQAIATMYLQCGPHDVIYFDPEWKALKDGYTYRWQEYLCPEAKALLMPQKLESEV
jgi:hypothetical protein